MNLSKEKQTMVSAASKAAKILLGYFGKHPKSKMKANESFVTVADIAANNAIIKEIKKKFPEHSIISEEIPFEDNRSDFVWIIDPLDGTHNFMHGIGVFGTLIALKYKNEVVLGIIGLPALGLTVIAEKGKGAYLNGKKIKVSDKKIIHHSFISFEYAYTDRKYKLKFLSGFSRVRLDLRNFGCAAYALFLIATGKSDGFVIFTTHEWDIAAGFLALEEAGGKVTDLHGNKWVSGEGSFVASNGHLHKELLKYAKKWE